MVFNEKTALKTRLEQLIIHEKQINSERNEILLRLQEIDDLDLTNNIEKDRTFEKRKNKKNQMIFPLLILKHN